ncbi:class I SAM-dependent methyltransferase [Citrobacter amalonaticus]|nr:class I SAM-dependent methyltransferase [Citrobacter amalonaticus]
MLNKENLFPAPPAKFLELGCGNAAMSSQLMAQKGYDVYGIDISPTAITWANERFSSLNSGKVKAMCFSCSLLDIT